jgi:hypothetical protein
MPASAKLYGKAMHSAFSGLINLPSDTIKAALCTSSYTPDQDAHDYFNDISGEVVGTGYTAGGATLGTKTLTYDGPSNTVTFDAADTSWATSTITARYAVIYKDTGTPSTSPLIGYVDFGADVSTTAGTFQITWNASGIFALSVA